MSLTPIPYAPLNGCDAVVNAWCDSNCPHFTEFGSLLARYDDQHVPGQPRVWRCYARHTLDRSETAYERGKAYCSRQLDILKIISACVAERELLASSSAVAIDAQGQGSAPSTSLPIESVRVDSGPVGASYGPAASPRAGEAADEDDTPRIGVVVAHCRETMPWLGELQRGLRDGHGGLPLRLELHVYEKCDDRSEDSWPRLGWQHERRTYLQNIGQECYAYLHYLRDLYHVLPDLVLFLQGGAVASVADRDIYTRARSFSAALRARSRRHRQQEPRASKSHLFRGSSNASTMAGGGGATDVLSRNSSSSSSSSAVSAASVAEEDASASAATGGDVDALLGGVASGGLAQLDGGGGLSGWAGAASHWANTYRTLNDEEYIAMGGSPEACSRLMLTCASCCKRGPPRLFECVAELYARHALTHALPGSTGASMAPRAFARYATAQFGVSRDRILARPLALYESLLREFEKEKEEQCLVLLGGGAGAPAHRGTCALFEYLWHPIMGEPPILDSRLTLSGKDGLHRK